MKARPQLARYFARRALGMLAICPLLCLGPTVARAQGSGTAVIALSRGAVEVQPAGTPVWQAAVAGAALRVGDRIRTGRGAAAELGMADGSLIRLGELSELQLGALDVDPQGAPQSSRFQLAVGRMRAYVAGALVTRVQRQTGAFGVETPTAVAAVRQTDFIVTFNPRTTLYVLAGLVQLSALRPGSVPVMVGRNRSSFVEDALDAATPRPIPADVRARWLAELPFESAPVPPPGAPTPEEAMKRVLRHLVQRTSTERTASEWLLGLDEFRLQTPGTVTHGRPNPATAPLPTRVGVSFN